MQPESTKICQGIGSYEDTEVQAAGQIVQGNNHTDCVNEQGLYESTSIGPEMSRTYYSPG